ncbi:transposase [Streptomyces sp. NPDC050485]|uniref:transposase n=1 Tax=Streptomyces sp. NPDC050485 TaxID=3365617 RepID=UPI0037B9F53A
MHRILLAELNAAGELDWTRACVDGSHVRAKKGGIATGLPPVDRRKTGSKHHPICDGKGTPLHVITTAANVNDITQTLDIVDGIPPVAGRPGRPRRRLECLLGDKAYDSKAVRGELRRRIQAVISRKGSLNIRGLGKLHRKGFERDGAPPLPSWWIVKSSYGGETREHSYPWVLPQSVTVRRLTFGVARSA